MNTIGEYLKQLWRKYQQEIILATGVFLISCISFAAGYLYASQTLKEPIRFETFDIQNIPAQENK